MMEKKWKGLLHTWSKFVMKIRENYLAKTSNIIFSISSHHLISKIKKKKVLENKTKSKKPKGKSKKCIAFLDLFQFL